MSDLNNNSDLGQAYAPKTSQGLVVELSLKFNYQSCTDTSIDLSVQNKLAFDIADTFSKVDTPLDRHVERGVQHEDSIQNRLLEKKLNIFMQLLNTLLANIGSDRKKSLLKLSAQTIEWDNSAFQSDISVTIKKDQNLIFEFYPESDLPYPIKCCGVIVNIQGSIITANFIPLDSRNQERFEKWIFQLHRRSIQKNTTKR